MREIELKAGAIAPSALVLRFNILSPQQDAIGPVRYLLDLHGHAFGARRCTLRANDAGPGGDPAEQGDRTRSNGRLPFSDSPGLAINSLPWVRVWPMT